MISEAVSRSVPSKVTNYIRGKAVEGSGRMFEVPNAATGGVLTTYKISTSNDVNAAIESAKVGQQAWSSMAAKERARILFKAAEIFRERNDELAEVEALDTGRPIAETNCVDIVCAVEALEFMASICATTASVGQHILMDGSNPGASFGYTRREPLGVTGGIGAWNYPLQSAIWKSAPSLACGNSMVFKPADNTPLMAIKLAEIFTEAGVPDGVFNVVLGDGPTTGTALSHHSDLAAISFTGSVPTGKKVYQAAAANMIPVTMELGGKSPFIVMDDANIENAVSGAMLANWYSCGEICSNGTRVFVQKGVYEQFLKRLVERTEKLTIGNPLNPKTDVGAMVSKLHLERVLNYVRIGFEEGAKSANGPDAGSQIKIDDEECKDGYYMKPLIFIDCKDDMRIVKEEIFGPVMVVLPFETEEEVIARANDTEYGLSAGIFTQSLARAHRMTAAIQAGTMWVNNYNLAPTEMPWRGYKKSGLGQENGNAIINYWTQEKSIYIEMGDADAGYPM
jgi:betaine-aldehyde dehydrogenase